MAEQEQSGLDKAPYFVGDAKYSNVHQIDIQQDGIVQIVFANTVRGRDMTVVSHHAMTLLNFQEMCRLGLKVVDQHQANLAERRARGVE